MATSREPILQSLSAGTLGGEGRESVHRAEGLHDEGIVYFGPEPWDGLWRNRHQLMSRFARNNLVLYVEPPLLSFARIRRLLEHRERGWRAVWPSGIRRVAENLYVLRSPIWLFMLGKHPFNALKRACWRAILRQAARRIGIRDPIIWLSRPQMRAVLGVLDEKLSIYHVVDEYSGYGGVTEQERQRLHAAEAEMLAEADLTIVVSPALQRSKSLLGSRVHLVPNAVDYEAYRADASSAIPQDMEGIPHPILGYSGLIGDRLDLALLRMLARRHPQWSLVLVGEVNRTRCETGIETLEKLPNVHFLGRKPVDQVPDYIRAFDVCVVPYRTNVRADYSSPLKIYEYAAAEKPIVTTNFEAATEFAEIVLTAPDHDGFDQLTTEAVQWPATHPRLKLGVELARANTWDHRLKTLSELIRNSLDVRQRDGRKPSEDGPLGRARVRRSRILYLVEHVTGGSVESLCILIENLNREAYEPIVLFLRSPTYQIRKRLGDAGAKVIIMETAARANGSAPQSRGFGLHARLTKFWGGRLVPLYHLARRLRKLFREDIPMAAAMRRELKHIDFDIVHINEGIARGKAGVLLAQSRRVPCICHERMWHECTLLERLFSRLVERMLYNSEAVKDREVAAGIPADKGVVIHNAVDPEEFQVPVDGPCPREEFGWEASHFVVALVGRLDWWKGHEQFILAINETLRRFPQVRALIVGEREVGPRNESYADTLLELQRDLGLEEQLVFTGHRDDVPRIMSDVDAVVLSSSEPEPFGRVVIEGMAAAKPVIATDSGGVPEIIAHRKTGLLIPLKDAHALAGAISELVADPELASALGKAGREEVEKRFTAATQLAKIQSIYEELSAQRRRRRVSTAAAAIE